MNDNNDYDTDDVFSGLGVRIKLKDEEGFLKVRETLTRIGIASRKDKKLWQSCHILHKRGHYAIMHFKEMFILDGRDTEVPIEDIQRRNKIAVLLEEWNLLDIIDTDDLEDGQSAITNIKIIPYKEKNMWTLEAKYTIGKG